MPDKPFEFEAALKELEEITLWFEGTDVDLDQGLVKFERGMELSSQLKAHLTNVENRVEKIKSRFAAGAGQKPPEPAESAVTEPNDDSQAGLFSNP